MRLRVAEIDQDTIAHVLGDKAIEPGDNLGGGAVIRGDDFAQILELEPRRQRGRADEVAEHHGQLPAFGIGSCRWRHRGGRRLATRHGNRCEQFPAMTNRDNANLPEILRRQLGEHLTIDFVVAERRLVLLETQAAQPCCNVRQAPPSPSSSAFASLRSGVSKPSVNQP
jgi:hypothetical protein